MRINNQIIAGVHKAYEQQKNTASVKKSRPADRRDDLKLSVEARLWGIANKALKELPEPARDLSELQKAVATGTYEVNSEEIAEKILQENRVDQTI